jgi:hypothetical protein
MTTRQGVVRWIKDTEMARLIGMSPGALRNWRTKDIRAGNVWPKPGRGGLLWRKFGGAVRYLLDAELLGGSPAEVEHGDAERG